MRLLRLTIARGHGILKAGDIVVTRGSSHGKEECEPMRKHTQRWILIALLLLMATIGSALHVKDAAQAPCRPTPKVCHPSQHPPPAV